MKKDQPPNENGRQSTAKLTFLFISIPIVVIVVMVIFWIIFKETRKQVEVAILISAPELINTTLKIDASDQLNQIHLYATENNMGLLVFNPA